MAINEQEVVDQDNESFKVTNDKKADWTLEKIKELEEEKERKKELAEERINPIKEWLADETRKIDDQIENFKCLLEEYANKLKEEDEDLKTHSLPYGKLKFRKQRPKWDYDDEKLVKGVEKAGLYDLIDVKKKVNKRDLKKQVEVAGNKIVNPSTGEIIEGVEIVERGEKFKIKVNN